MNSAANGSGQSASADRYAHSQQMAPRTPNSLHAGRSPSNRGMAPVTPIHQSSRLPQGYVPAYLPGSASLVEELDQRILIVLRDGKHLIGTLCSYDQYSNLVLQGACERRMATVAGVTSYTDIPLGIYIVRGDSVVLMGCVLESAAMAAAAVVPAAPDPVMQPVSLDELKQLENKGDAPLQWDFDTDLIA